MSLDQSKAQTGASSVLHFTIPDNDPEELLSVCKPRLSPSLCPQNIQDLFMLTYTFLKPLPRLWDVVYFVAFKKPGTQRCNIFFAILPLQSKSSAFSVWSCTTFQNLKSESCLCANFNYSFFNEDVLSVFGNISMCLIRWLFLCWYFLHLAILLLGSN